MTTDPLDLDAIEARAKAASPDWFVYGDCICTPSRPGTIAEVLRVTDAGTMADARFAAAARTDIPRLVAEVRALRAERDSRPTLEQRRDAREVVETYAGMARSTASRKLLVRIDDASGTATGRKA